LNELLSMLESVGSGGGQFGRIHVDLTAADSAYPNPPIIVPLHLKNMESGRVPVTNAPVPVFRGATLVNGSSRVKLDMVLDTGGAVSLISRRVARKLGLDLGSPELKTMVMGVGKGNAQLNGYWLDGLTIRTSSGGPIFYRRVPFFIADIEGVQGTVGANLLVPSVYINMEKMLDSTGQEANPLAGVMQIFSDMKPGPTPFREIIIDLPHSRLGLVPYGN
jgi:hypothetical protein